MKGNSFLDNKWVVTAINALITTIITVSLTLIVDKFKPVDPRVEAQLKQFDAQVKQADAHIKQFDAQIKQAETATKKDELMIALTKRLTGKVDDQTVEKVKQDVMDYLARAMQQYPTKEEFAREKHRFIDKAQGVIWEAKMDNGNMSLLAVAPYTNNTVEVKQD